MLFSCEAQKAVDTATDGTTANTSAGLSESVRSTFPQEAPANGVIRMKEGENLFLKDAQMNLTFTKAVQDSRCPMNARCISAGNATIEIEAMATTSRPFKFKLSVGDLKNGLVNHVDFSRYRIRLENLYPSNSTDTGFEQLKGRYIADFKIEKITK